jgi:maltooligosyltrehalose trehalohydrolase
VHAFADTTAIHVLEQLATETDALADEWRPPPSLIPASDLNDPRLITPHRRRRAEILTEVGVRQLPVKTFTA